MLLSISTRSFTVQTIQFSTMHLICPSGLVRIPNHFNSLVKLAKHFLISLNTATAQCSETKLYLWRVTKMESRAGSCVNVYSFTHTQTLHHSKADMWSREGIIYTRGHTLAPTHMQSNAQFYTHTRTKKKLQSSHL